jgi:hypothetical protein
MGWKPPNQRCTRTESSNEEYKLAVFCHTSNLHYLDERVLMEGKATPSASPKNARTARRATVEWLAAHGVSRVARDHKATPHAITLFPPYLSTRAPPMTDENMYHHRKDDFKK